MGRIPRSGCHQAAITVDNSRLFDSLQRANLDLSLAYDATIAGWSRALDLREHETERHSDRVTDMTMHLARAMTVPDEDLIHLRRGALLHDIGKMGIPDAILLKPGRLTLANAPSCAGIPCSPMKCCPPFPTCAQPWISLCAPRKMDGTGYPRGLAGDQIPLAARIFSVVDVFDALTNQRPYRLAWPRQKALDYIYKQAANSSIPGCRTLHPGRAILAEAGKVGTWKAVRPRSTGKCGMQLLRAVFV